MRQYSRAIEGNIKRVMKSGKAVLVLGARRVGKTHLIKKIVSDTKLKGMYYDGEDWNVQDAFSEPRLSKLKELVSGYDVVCIDEAQQIPNMGKVAKLMVDNIDGLRILLSGSSALSLAGQTGEPLTGRKSTVHMFSLSQAELSQNETPIETKSKLEERLLFGSYPEVILTESRDEKKRYLRELVNDYLLKDVLELENIRNSDKLRKMLRMLAYQVGQIVSTQELGKAVGLNRGTVERYLDLLAKGFVIFRVDGYSKNLRKEITKSSKWFFYDNGIRNALNGSYQPMDIRPDRGALWENYVIAERIKHLSYTENPANFYFWRTYDKQEIDWIEERDGSLIAMEMKWNPKSKKKAPGGWVKNYPESEFSVVTPDNYLQWIR